ncbi:hypothetical protein HII31_09768 [Pseudocercospora fuligena]|uniref:Transcription factor domain-containing protein n=1 Tax=Pseudocercospora fuligena TaxID=685502 RepID=A0A8H6VEX7_9PEZI|nr:hypothetical protein HII31_09768 [Pseudocercospora fuligena]
MSTTTPLPLYSQFRFVTSNGDFSGGKRQIAARACERCRKRKKRCDHASREHGVSPTSNVAAQEAKDLVSIGPEQRLEREQLPPRNSNEHSTPAVERSGDLDARTEEYAKRTRLSSSKFSQERFIGDLNPEAELLEASSPAANRRPLTNRIGLWRPEDPSEQIESATGTMFGTSSILHGCSEEIRRSLVPALEHQTFRVRPAPEHISPLKAFYIQHIHPILPCLDMTLYHRCGPESPIRIVMEQAMCLLAAPDPAIRHHLRIAERTYKPPEFIQAILSALRLSLELAIVPDVTTAIRVLTVMSLMSFGQRNLELTSGFFSKAVHLGYTIGVHQPRDEEHDQKVADLFCLLWSVDRMHAAFHGRPILMHKSDMAKDPMQCARHCSSGFRTLVYIATLLDSVIALYRPNAEETEISDLQFPSFEEVLALCQSSHLCSRAIATLELFYHAVATLSVRISPNTDCRHPGTRNTRQTASVLQIVSAMEAEAVNNVTLLPFVPYAVSLALSAALRDMRHSSVATKQERARQQANKCCKSLRQLGQSYWSASITAEMAMKILQSERPPARSNSEGVTIAAHDEVEARTNAQSPNIGLQTEYLDFLDPSWDVQDLEGILENNLDLSIPSFYRDQDLFAFNP